MATIVILSGCGGGGGGAISSPVPAKAVNGSYTTLCAEVDNASVYFFAKATTVTYAIEATHPTYGSSSGSCSPDFAGCSTGQDVNYPFTPGVYKLFDDGTTVVEAVREAQWWRPEGMEASVNAGAPKTDIHYIRLSHKISGVASWPQFLVLYMDGNLRLKPQPPAGTSDTCFGSSVIVGPNAEAKRPFAEISSVKYVSSSGTLEIAYKDGNMATLHIKSVSRDKAIVVVTTSSSPTVPFVTFRSMYVGAGNADVDSVQWKDASGTLQDVPIMDYKGGDVTELLFHRTAWSKHNTSAPDIRIKL